MARLKRPEPANPNPTTLWLEWKSNEKSFAYYDKEKGEDVLVELPQKFLFLEHYHRVGGFHEARGEMIFSNEVYSIGSEELKAATKSGSLVSGLYKEIKDKLPPKVYRRSIYLMTPDGEIVNVNLKGSASAVWSKFYPEYRGQLDDHWVEVKEAKEEKKGSVKYSVPVFTIGKKVTAKENELADTAAATLQDFVDSRREADASPAEALPEDPVAEEEVIDEVDF